LKSSGLTGKLFKRYAGHEYTAGNLAFAKSVLGDEDPAIIRLAEVVKENKITVGHSTIADEKVWNVFMRLGTDTEKYVFCLRSRIRAPNR
jgi:Hydroxyacylglutathione hydrolase C-terminus